jgi:hypothetical protein
VQLSSGKKQDSRVISSKNGIDGKSSNRSSSGLSYDMAAGTCEYTWHRTVMFCLCNPGDSKSDAVGGHILAYMCPTRQC